MSVDKIDVTETINNVRKTLAEDKSLSPQVRALMEILVVIVNLLANKLNLNSSNSSKPPSTDPNRERGAKNKGKGKKLNPGGQAGHVGTNLEKIKNPDKIETIKIDRETLPKGRYTYVGYEDRQVIEIIISREVTEYRAEILENAKGKQFTAPFPKGVTRPVQYGKDLKAQAVYMSQQQLIPYERVQDYFFGQCGVSISTGSLCNFNKEAYDMLESFEAIARKWLIVAPLMHNDETGINVNGKLLWLHCASSDLWTIFFPHVKRGSIAMKEMGILEYFKGVSVHDHWKPYFLFNCKHAMCNAHHLRELKRAWEQDGQKWAKKIRKLLLEIKDAVEVAGGAISKNEAKKFQKQYRSILTLGSLECPASKIRDTKRGRVKQSKARNLLNRLRDFETATLRFMTDKRVPFTNNQGERDIRMTKVQQKISGCFRGMEGARIFCRIRGYLSTCRKHGLEPPEALKLLFAGKLPKFARAP